MASVYAAFLQSPNASHLAPGATLNYITSTTVLHEPNAIIKHLNTQQKLVEKKNEKVLSVIESTDSLFLETETTLRFLQGGGAYLPGLDENLLDEKIVTFPLLHVVQFDADSKIRQIRLYWDQGSLLKQVEAIGRTGRNWPIRDGTAQVETIHNSIAAARPGSSDGKTPLGARSVNEVVINQTKNPGAVRNQPGNLSLFTPRDPNEYVPADFDGPKQPPRQSVRPEQRELSEIVGEAIPASRIRSSSPSKEGVIFKAGAGKHYNDIRLFDEHNDGDVMKSPVSKKTFEQKYEHFDFGDGEDAPPPPSKPSSRGHRHQPTFSFEDFATPAKHVQRQRPDDKAQWSLDMSGDNENAAPGPRGVSRRQKARDEPEEQWNWGTAQEDKKIYKTHGDGMGGRNTVKAWRIGEDVDAVPEEKKIYKTAGDGMGGRNAVRAWRIGEDDEAVAEEMKIYKTSGDGMGGRSGVRPYRIGEHDS